MRTPQSKFFIYSSFEIEALPRSSQKWLPIIKYRAASNSFFFLVSYLFLFGRLNPLMFILSLSKASRFFICQRSFDRLNSRDHQLKRALLKSGRRFSKFFVIPKESLQRNFQQLRFLRNDKRYVEHCPLFTRTYQLCSSLFSFSNINYQSSTI